MSNTNFSTNMGYSRTVSSGSSSGGSSGASPSAGSWNFDTDLELYQRTNTATETESLTENDGSINLNMFLEVDGGSSYETGAVTGSLGLELADLDNRTWYEKAFDAVGAAVATATSSLINFTVSLTEGIVSFAEAVVDAGVLVLAISKTSSLILSDGLNLALSQMFGNEFNSLTKSFWTEQVMPFIGTNWTDKLYDGIYSTGPMQWVENNALGPFKREDGVVYSIGKGTGYTAGLVLATIFTAGIAGVGAAGSAAAGSTVSTITPSTISAIFAGLGGAGKATQKGYNGLDEAERNSMWELTKVSTYGVGSGIIEGLAWFFTFGKGTEILSKPINLFDDAASLLNKLLGTSVKDSHMVKVAVQYAKAAANTAIDWITIQTKDFSWDTVGATLKEGTINALISLVYDNTISPKIGKWSENLSELLRKIRTKPMASTPVGELIGDSSSTEGGQFLPDDVIEAAKNGLKKVFGGFFKKFMDYRQDKELIGQLVGS